MMDEIRDGQGVPAWFWVVAVLALLFEAFGCYAYLTDVTRTADQIAQLPIDEQSLRAATPWWIYAAYAVAVWVGLFGAILLLLRRRHAESLLLVSLIAVVVQFGGVLLVPELRDGAPPDSFTLPIIIAVIAYGLWHFARHSRRRGWLR
jgi:hypothetical protein